MFSVLLLILQSFLRDMMMRFDTQSYFHIFIEGGDKDRPFMWSLQVEIRIIFILFYFIVHFFICYGLFILMWI